MSATINAVLAQAAAAHPEREAVVIGDRRLTHAALDEAAGRTAAGFAALGIGRGDRVAILSGNAIEWITAWFGAARLGAAAVPINTRWKDDEIAWALDYAEVGCLVFSPAVRSADLRGTVDRVRRRLRTVDRFVIIGDRQDANWALPFAALDRSPVPDGARPDDIALIQFTSGSTARPKGVMLTQAGMLTNARGSAAALGLGGGDRYFSPRPFFHVAGSTGGILRALVSGATLFSIPTFEEAEALSVIRRERCQLVAGNDAMFLKLLDGNRDGPLADLRGGQVAAGPEVQRRIHDELGIPGLCGSYGLSEASPGVAFSHWNDPLEDRIAGLMRPLPGVEIRIRSPEDGGDLPAGRSGEILVRGPSVMVGYWAMPQETAAVLDADRWLATGDLGMLAPDGRLRFLGRLKDVIRVGGENVSPAEVENLLLQHPAVAAAQVVGLADARLAEVPVAYVAPRPGTAIDAAQLRDWARDRIAGFKAPRHIGVVAGFDDVMTGSGKPQKAALRQRAARDFGGV